MYDVWEGLYQKTYYMFCVVVYIVYNIELNGILVYIDTLLYIL